MTLRLKRLELYGFKSFGQKTVLHFDRPVSVIVGPNGSGKSNIADAMRWVLGEQSAKSLRGGKMADVIFSGTDQKKPLNMTQVTLVLDNQDKKLPIAYDEVVVSRKLFRSGETEYALNRTGCRLKDIRSLFMDTGVGKEGYSIIGQGKIDEIISTRDQDRRELFEEATGISKYRYQIEEARSKLEKTKENLLRVEDIITQLKEQLRYLSKEAEKAKKGMQLTVEHETHTLAFYDKEVKAAQFLLQGLKEEKEQLQANLTLSQQKREEIRAKVRPLLEKREWLAQEKASLDEQERILSRNRESAERNLQLSEQKSEFLQRDTQRLKEEGEQAENELARLTARHTQLETEEEAIRERLKKEEEQQGKEKAVCERLEEETAQLQTRLREAKEAAREAERAWRDAQLQLQTGENAAQLRVDQTEKLRELLKAQEERKDILHTEYAALKKASEQTEKDYRALTEQLSTYDAGIERDTRAILQEENALREQENELEAKQRRLLAIDHMIKNHEGYHRSVQQLLRAAQEDATLRARFIGPLGGLLTVDSAMRLPIEIALGAALHNIVTREAVQAKQLIEWLKKNRIGRVTFLPVDQIRAYPYQGAIPDGEKGVIGAATDFVSAKEDIGHVLSSLLGRTVLLEDMDTGIRLRKNRAYDRLRFVTRAGELLLPGGSMVGGYTQKEGGLLSRESDRDQLAAEIPPLERRVQESRTRIRHLRDNKEKNTAQREETRNKGRILHENRRTAAENLAAKEAQTEVFLKSLEQTQKQLAQMQTEESVGSLRETLLFRQEELAEKERAAQKTEARFAETEAQWRKAEQEYGQTRARTDGQRRDISLIKNRMADVQEQINARENEKNGAQKALKETVQAEETEKQSRDKLCTQLLDTEEKERVLQEKKRASDKERTTLEHALQAHENEQKEAEERFRTLEKDQATHTLRLENAQDKVKRLFETVAMELNTDEETAAEKMQAAPQIKTSRSRVREIKEQLRAIGSFSFESIEEHKTVQERFDFLTEQSADLKASAEDLKEVIRKIEATMRKQFRDGMVQINKKFSEVFKILFDGGQAEVALTGEDVLEAGVQIIAKPPGKTRQAITLLSGGEKALTAVALLFAIFETRPSPFCVLDEIDAALDDANIARYKQYLESFRGRIQFIIITHRKQTMELADIIYGVTMQDNATSRIIPLELADKKKEQSA